MHRDRETDRELFRRETAKFEKRMRSRKKEEEVDGWAGLGDLMTK